ncbi:hypothetical protein SLEP1_g55456 [Rubroshorea leprosula]|uniref:Uncharacterized protein n=1 Tax=Rubroshorea leprosula TaxID=152421 RepID=A0AAV5MFJ5_9ROSI|nr:hypothetical protein SLEP1_g55456 [Rubroshorea leprosula]
MVGTRTRMEMGTGMGTETDSPVPWDPVDIPIHHLFAADDRLPFKANFVLIVQEIEELPYHFI